MSRSTARNTAWPARRARRSICSTSPPLQPHASKCFKGDFGEIGDTRLTVMAGIAAARRTGDAERTIDAARSRHRRAHHRRPRADARSRRARAAIRPPPRRRRAESRGRSPPPSTKPAHPPRRELWPLVAPPSTGFAGPPPRFAGEDPDCGARSCGSSPAKRGRGTMRSMVEGARRELQRRPPPTRIRPGVQLTISRTCAPRCGCAMAPGQASRRSSQRKID